MFGLITQWLMMLTWNSFVLYLGISFKVALKDPEEEENQWVWDINFFDYFFIPVILIARCFILGVKYSFYSDQHVHIIENHTLPNILLSLDLIAFQSMNDMYDLIRDRIKEAMHKADVRPN
jgi:hypothetical protein